MPSGRDNRHGACAARRDTAIETHTLRLTGERARGPRIAATALQGLLNGLVEGSRRAVRLRLEGRSTARGSPPTWLEAAADFDVIAIAEGSTLLELEARTLAEACPDRFEQTSLLYDYNKSGLSFLEESLAEAFAARADSDLFDDGLLSLASDFGKVLALGFTSIEWCNTAVEPLSIRTDGIGRVQELRQRTPPSRRVKVAGTLDLIRHSDRMFKIVLEDDTTVRGVAEVVEPNLLGQLFGKRVVVSGTAVFRPSGSLLRVEADSVAAATGDVSVWSGEPRPLLSPVDRRSIRRPQGPRSGVNAIVGRWPGNESDDEISSWLKEMS